jgi:uncharacterized protein (TIGR02246 family)
MKYLLLALLAGVFGLVAYAGGTAPTLTDEKLDRSMDEAAIKQLGKNWQDGWNKRDAAALAALLAEDVDFITVRGPNGWLKGRDHFREDHAGKLKTQFADSEWTTKDVHVKFVRPDLALARVLWATKGDKVRHVKHGAPREGVFTWVVENKHGRWQVIASQNSETMPPLPGQ